MNSAPWLDLCDRFRALTDLTEAEPPDAPERWMALHTEAVVEMFYALEDYATSLGIDLGGAEQ